MDWRVVLDTILANPQIWWFVVTGALSFGFKWLAPKAPAIHEMLASVSVDVPRFLNGLRMLVKPSTKALPAVSGDQ